MVRNVDNMVLLEILLPEFNGGYSLMFFEKFDKVGCVSEI
jgi:hypothetical protein